MTNREENRTVYFKFVAAVGFVLFLVLGWRIIMPLFSGDSDEVDDVSDSQVVDDSTDDDQDVEVESSEPEVNEDQDLEEESDDTDDSDSPTVESSFDHSAYDGRYMGVSFWDIEIPISGTGGMEFSIPSANRLSLASTDLKAIVGDDCQDENVFIDRGKSDDTYQGSITFAQAFSGSSIGNSLALTKAGDYYYIYTPGTASCEAGSTSDARQVIINLATGIRELENSNQEADV